MAKNSEYWEKRIANETWKTYNSIEDENAALLGMYEKTSKGIRNELYALAEKAEVTGSLSRTDGYRFKKLLGQQGYIYSEVEKLYTELEQHATAQAVNGSKKVYDRVMENLGIDDFKTPDKKAMTQMLNQPWQGSSFSKRLWSNAGKLEKELNSTLNLGITTGKTTTEIAIQLANAMNQSFNVTHRLIRTETINCMNRSALRGYTDAGVKRVQWWAAEDERTCEVCGTNHGKKYDIDKAPNLPCHPGCRCTWLPVVDSSELNSKLNLNEEKDGLNIMKFRKGKSSLPANFIYSPEKQHNVTEAINEIVAMSKRTGVEYMTMHEAVTGKRVSQTHTSKSSKSVKPSFTMLVKMKKAAPDSLTLIHNHPNSTSFSIADIVSKITCLR